MSKNELLYVKGMNVSESDEEGEEDIWDDRKINAAYDKAMKVANAEVAKRLAMATNSQQGGKEGSAKKKNSKSQRQNEVTKSSQWKAGMPCRAVYEDDGLEYEALIVRIVTDDECVVQFLGYDNREIVKLSSLKPTQGKEARTLQIEVAATERGESVASSSTRRETRGEASASSSTRRESMDVDSDRDPSPGSTTVIGSDRSLPRKKKSSKKKNRNRVHNFELPDIPMPNFNMMGNLGSMEMPMPPPMMMPSHNLNTEEQTLSSMLLSWYMSGYYTGLYQGTKRGKEQSRRRNN